MTTDAVAARSIVPPGLLNFSRRPGTPLRFVPGYLQSRLRRCLQESVGARLGQGTWELGVAEEGFETVVHVLLDVAVKQGETGLIGGEVHGGAAVIGDDYRVLDDA